MQFWCGFGLRSALLGEPIVTSEPPAQVQGEEVNVVRLVVPLKPAGERAALDVQSGIAAVHVLVSGTYRDLVVEAVLDAGAEAELLVEGQIGRALAFRHRRAVITAADRPQPAGGKCILHTERDAPVTS